MIEWAGPVPDSNYTVGRESIDFIVDHWMDTSFASAMARFMNPASIVSAHYLISQDGRIVQVVKDEDTAYHAGSWPANVRSIGVEHEASPDVSPSEALYKASAWLHATLAARYSLTLAVGLTMRPHRQIVPTQCPGSLDLDRIVREAMSVEFVTTDTLAAYQQNVRDTVDAIKTVLAAQATEIKTAEVKAVVEAQLGVLDQCLKPKP